MSGDNGAARMGGEGPSDDPAKAMRTSETIRPELDPGWSDSTWTKAEPAPVPRKSFFDVLRGAFCLALFALSTLLLMAPFFILRALGGKRERAVAVLWSRIGLSLCGLRRRQLGTPMTGGGAILANHVSWLDIMAIAGHAPVFFVAKAEIENWPFFGWLGRICNTEFIVRRRVAAKQQEQRLAARAQAGDLLCLFPEGTSTDGLRVLPFKSSLFGLFYSDPEAGLRAQPVSIHYAPRPGLPQSFFGWWGRMSLFKHIWDVACLGARSRVVVTFHTPLSPGSFADRKALAAAAQDMVEQGRFAAAEQA